MKKDDPMKMCKCGRLKTNHTYDEARRCRDQELANAGQIAGTKVYRY